MGKDYEILPLKGNEACICNNSAVVTKGYLDGFKDHLCISCLQAEDEDVTIGELLPHYFINIGNVITFPTHRTG